MKNYQAARCESWAVLKPKPAQGIDVMMCPQTTFMVVPRCFVTEGWISLSVQAPICPPVQQGVFLSVY